MADKHWWEKDKQGEKKYWWQKDTTSSNGQSNTQSNVESDDRGSEKRYWWNDGSIGTAAGSNIVDRVNGLLGKHSNYVSDYQNRNSGRKYNLEDSYMGDHATWLESATSSKNAMYEEADNILSYIDRFGKYLDPDWVKEVKNTIAKVKTDQDSILGAYKKDSEYWSSFKDEDEYKTAQRYDGYKNKYANSTFDEIKAAIETLEDGEEKDWLAYNQAALYKNQLSQNADFDERSKYKSTYRGDEVFNYWTGMYTDTGYDDIFYDYINRDETARSRQMLNDIATNMSFYGLDKSYLEEMTDDEIAIYNYLYDPNDKTASEEYLAYILSDLNYRQRARRSEEWAKYASEHPVLSSVFSVLTSPLKTITALGQYADYVSDGTIDQNAGYNKFSYIPTTIRNQVSSDIAKSGKWGEVGSWTYNLGMSMGDFVMSTAVSGGNSALSLALMGSGAMSDTVISAKDRGLSDDQAMILGVVAAGAEIVTEKFSLDALFKGGMEKGAMRYILTNAFTEGTEEVSSSLINTLADVLVSKDKSMWQQEIDAYLAEHPEATEEEAFQKVLGDNVLSLGLDFLGGALMGGTMGSGGAAINQVTNARPGLQVNKDAVKDYGDRTDAIIQEGLESDKKSTSYYLANKYQQKVQGKDGKDGKALTGYEIRNLLAANQEQVTPKDMKKIQTAAEKRLTDLGQTKDVLKVAELATKWATGQKLTRAEKSFLANSEYGSRVANELLPANIASGEYSTAWAEEIGTKEVNAGAYNAKTIRTLLDAMANAEDSASYKSLEERVGTDAKFNVSESGQATIHGTDEAISLDKVEVTEFIKDKETGKVTDMVLKVDGKEVKASEIDYADDSQSHLFSAVSQIENISPADAQAIIRDYDPASGLSVGEYLNGIDEGFTYGYHNYSEADLKAGNFAPKLGDVQAKSAYVLGQNASKNRDTNKTEAIVRMRTAVEAEAEKAKAEGKEAPKSKELTITVTNEKGETVTIDEADTTEGKQSGGIKVAQMLHKLGLGTNFRFFTSYLSETMKVKDKKTGKLVPARVFLDENGVEQLAPAGVYRMSDGTICIDMNAYNGRQLTLNALAHELTHFIQQWSTKKYKVLVDFLMQTYEDTGITMHQRVLREQARLKEIRGEEISYNEAYDEVVANAMMKMFDDGKLVERLTELKVKDKKLAQKLWEGFKEILNKFLGFYQKEKALFRDADDLMKMKEAFEQLQNMFAEALVEASENFQANLMATEVGVEPVAVEDVSQYSYSSLAEAAGFVAVQNEDGTRSFTRDGEKVSKVTVEDIENSPIGAFINFSLEMGDISDADAQRQKQMFADICTMACKTNDFAMTMQFVGSAVFTGMKANADKQYGTTYDFPSICTKTQAVIDAMSAKMMSLGRGLKADEIVQLYDDVFASGNPVPCPECYVFSRWIGIGGLLDNIKKYQDYYGDMDVEDVAAEYRKMKAEVSKFADEQGISFGKAKGALTSKLTNEFNKLTEKIEKAENQGEKVKASDRQRLAELEPMMNTVNGMTWLENVYFADSSLKKVNPKFRVPNEILFDLNNGEAFATQYKEAWAFRTTQGAGYGKAITPYAEARLGEGVLVTNNTTNAIKGRAQGSLNNYFLNQNGKLDKQSRDALKRARLKQLIQAFIGGQRFQSTSDARYENASDYLLAALEMQAMRGMVQVYTKVDGAVPAFSAWGFSINQSLMPLNGGLDEDGNVKDTGVGGMKPEVAFKNRNNHETAGTITIGVNDNHIRAMFKQLVRDFIIPYHASGGKADVVAAFRRIQEGKEAKGKAVRSTDYSRTQSDKVLSDDVLRWQGKTDAQIQRIHEIRNARIAILTGGKPNMTVVRSNKFLSALYDKLNGGEWDGVKLAKSKVESQIYPNEFWDQTVSYEESAKITKDYLEYCEDLGFLHRFSGMVQSNGKLVPVNGYNENGERVQLTDLAYKYDANGNKTTEVEEFFWKVLTDRRMYDNNGKYLPQKVVTLNDTTTDTVTGFAKNNQGRQYDKAKAEALAQKIVKGEQYSSQETDVDINGDTAYDSIGLNDIKDVVKRGTGIKWNNGNVIQLERKEYAAVTSRISTEYNRRENHGGVQYIERSTDGKDAKLYLYLFVDHGFDNYEIIARLDYAKQDGLIDELRRMIQNGRETERVSTGSGGLRSFYGNAARSGNGSPNRGLKNANDKKNSGSRGQRSRDNRRPGATDSDRSHERGNSTRGVKEQFSSQETDLDVGYHAGDLGKAESLRQQGLGRDTGHFGTGTYFVGNKTAIEGYNSRGGKPAPIETVDFDKYKLFKPKNANDGFALHDFLRGVDGYWNRDADAVNTMEEYESLQEKLGDLVYDIESEEFGETDPHKESWLAVEREFLSDAKRMMGGYKVGKELTDTLSRLTNGNFQYDARSGEYYSYDFDTDQFTYYTEDEIIQKLNAEEGGWKAFEGIEKLADDYYSYSRTSRYESWSESIKYVARILGLSEQKVRTIFQSVTEDINSRGYTDADMETADSAATRFMKALGYEGIDVRGIKELDNTSYGSVIYDLKGEDLARKKAIGTAKYSTQETDSISNRDLLANAFESISQNSEEYKLIQRYKNRIQILNELEAKLSKLNSEIRQIRFGKDGVKDMAKLRQLEAEAKNTAKLINTQDKKLLSLEASEPLRKVIEQERKKEAQKTKEHIKDIQQNRKVKAEQAEIRHKIRKAIRDLDKILNRGNKKQNVKEDMQVVVSKALKAADILFTDNFNTYDMLRNGLGVDLSDAEEALVNTCTQMLKDLDKMPTDGHENWQAYQEAESKLKTKMSKLNEVFARERKRLNNTTVSSILGELADAYASLEDSEQSYVQGAYTEAVHNYLKNLQNEVGGTIVKDMTKDQLEYVYTAYKMVLQTVRNANKMFNNELKQSREQLGNAVIEEVIKAGGVHLLGTKVGNTLSQASWNNMKPIWVGDRIGSDTFGKLMDGLFKGQYDFAVDIAESKKFKLEMDEKYHPRDWDAKKSYEFESSTGKKFNLDLQQIMSLYAYTKRGEQAIDHLTSGGFVFEKNSTVIVEKDGKKKSYIHKGAASYKLNEATLNGIINSLTPEQKAYVDEMQAYLSNVMGAKGNEVSMALYGIKMFNEQFYFPLRSSGAYMERAKEAEMKKQQGQINLVNSGFTHSVKPKAKNPIILAGFMDVWAEHCNEMSMYHSMVLPMEDFRKVYNYTTVHDENMESASVFQTIQDAYGEAATSYIDQLYKELNAGATIDPRETVFKQFISNFKKSAVMLSGSVVVQQFSAIGRAYAVIDPRYFVGSKVNSDTGLSAVEEMKKYAPVAIIKEMGGFDTGTKGNATSYIKAEEYHGVKDKAKGLFTDKQYRGDVMGFLPAWADEKTWCAIWEAAKRETKVKHSDMDVKSEEFLKLAGELFSEAIEKTQVYDSVLARSANMRSKGAFMNMATAFMAEPTTTVNLIESAIRTGKAKNIARAFGAVAVSIVLNNALASIVYAMRDDDEDETLIEKYFQSFTSGMIDDINPMTYYPFLKDVWSLFQGYDVERSDMSVIADVRDALKQAYTLLAKDTSNMTDDELAEHNKKLWGALGSVLDAGCSAFGVPIKNVRRDAMGIVNAWNTVSKDVSGERSNSWNSFWDKVGSAAKDAIPFLAWTKDKPKADKLYGAIMSGDKAYLERMKSTYVDKEGNFDPDKYDSAVRKALRENDSRIHEAALARYNGNTAEYKRIFKEIQNEGKFSFDDIMSAINTEVSKIKGELEPEKETSEYSATDFVDAILVGDTSTARAMRDSIISFKMSTGTAREEAEESFESSVSTSARNAFDSGLLNATGAKNMLMEYAGKDEEEAASRVDYWAFAKANPKYRDDLSEARVKKFREYAEPANISLDVFMQFVNGTAGLETKYDDWGDVELSKRDQVLEVIDSLPLTWQQKDALYLAAGYSENNIWDVPW